MYATVCSYSVRMTDRPKRTVVARPSRFLEEDQPPREPQKRPAKQGGASVGYDTKLLVGLFV